MASAAFPMIWPDAVIGRTDLSKTARLAFLQLNCFRSRRTGQCNPHQTTLATMIGCSVAAIRRALAELRRLGMIVVRRTLFGNTYELATPDRWQTTISATECALKNERCASLTSERTHRSSVIPGEPVCIEPSAPPEALLLLPADQEATTTTPAAGGTQPENPMPPAPGGSPGEPAAVTPSLAPFGPLANTGITSEAEKLVNELLAYHPWKGNRPWAIRAIAKVLNQDPAAADQIRRSHVAMRPHWEIEQSLSPGKFRPPLGQWIEEGNWKAEAAAPALRKDVERETWIDRRKREQKESDDESYRMYAELGMWDAIRQYGGDELVEVWREKVKQAC